MSTIDNLKSVIQQDQLRERSGSVTVNSKLVSFLYELMRDHVPQGILEKLVIESQTSEVKYTNGWLASYAADIAKRLDCPPKT